MKRIAYCQLESCLQPIDPAKLAKRPTMRFCCREHATAWRQARGEYQRIGKLGNDAQAAYKVETGHIPKYEKRRDAVAKSNASNPRRGRKLCQDCGRNKTHGRSWFCEECKYKRQLARNQQWKESNPEKVEEGHQDWISRHPDYYKDYHTAKRRARGVPPRKPRGKTSRFASVKEYEHHYYETVTKPKRQAKEKRI